MLGSGSCALALLKVHIHPPNGESQLSHIPVQLGLVKIQVHDFLRATAWYGEVLGLQEQFGAEQGDGQAYYDSKTGKPLVSGAGTRARRGLNEVRRHQPAIGRVQLGVLLRRATRCPWMLRVRRGVERSVGIDLGRGPLTSPSLRVSWC